MPLGEGILKVNLGIPLIILCTKSDTIEASEKGVFTDQLYEIYSKHIRTFALLCTLILLNNIVDGATTIFISEKTQINLELFYKYLLHRLYKFPLKYKAVLDEKQRNFIPSGLDSLTLIRYQSKLIFKWINKRCRRNLIRRCF